MILRTQEPTKPRTGKFLACNKFRKLKYLPVTFLLFIQACSGPTEHDRPRDPWVYRSVLDQRPRMITMALDKDLWSAYDARKCGLYKAWQGGVDFDGAVYTTKHGPQPTSYGTVYLLDSLHALPWKAMVNGAAQVVEPQYKGHYFHDDQVSLKYQFHFLGNTIKVEETPEHFKKDGLTGLSRSFEVSGLPPGQQLQLRVVLNNLPDEFSYSTSGVFEVQEKDSKTYGGVTTIDVVGLLLLENGTTSLEAVFKVSTPAKIIESEPNESNEISQGSQLIENSDCKTCHNETVKTVGPSYLAIAEKYPTSDGTVRLLARKIISGGEGNWGEVPMTAHPDLTEPDAENMVRFILSLDKEEQAPKEGDIMLNNQSIVHNQH